MPQKKLNKITVLLDTEQFDRFERYCEAQGFKKSTLIARLIRQHLDAERFELQQALPLRQSGAGQ